MSRIRVQFEGFVAKDPTYRVTQSGGEPVLDVTVAHQKRRRSRITGEYEDVGGTTWIRASLWGDQASRYRDVLAKGDEVLISADDVETRAYMGGSGKPEATLELRFATIAKLPPRPRNDLTPRPEADYERPF